MLYRPAEASFAKGIDALTNGRGREALALFEAAIELDKKNGQGHPQPRYFSFYGLCLAFERKKLSAGIRCCREAMSREFYNPDLCCNLGRLLFLGGRRGEAYQVLIKGYRLQPNHAGIKDALEKMGRRRQPIVKFLGRNNPLNVMLGKMAGPT